MNQIHIQQSAQSGNEVQSANGQLKKRPLGKRIMHLVRRGHLYFGLFLVPWALLYGVTGFLFNHPTFFADAATVHFSREDLIGTELEHVPSPKEQAAEVLAVINEKQKPSAAYSLGVGEARYANRDTFVATVKAEPRTFFVVYDPKAGSGTIRETTPRPATETAPFATGQGEGARPRGMGMAGPMKHNHAGVSVPNPITDRIKSAIPGLLEKKGFPKGEVTVTTAPEIKFPVIADGQTWTASFNPITTVVSGKSGPEESELSVRGFLLRLHLSRGYPGEVTTKWIWAVGVDAMALILCFWAISGLFMWWQIKATRKAGLIVLVLSAICSGLLAAAMYLILS